MKKKNDSQTIDEMMERLKDVPTDELNSDIAHLIKHIDIVEHCLEALNSTAFNDSPERLDAVQTLESGKRMLEAMEKTITLRDE